MTGIIAENHPSVARDTGLWGRFGAAIAGNLGLRHVLFGAFTLIATIPVVMLGVWVERSALNKEIAAVKEKHLLLAFNLTGSLSRYVRDVESVFALATQAMEQNLDLARLSALLDDLSYDHVCLVDREGRIGAFLRVGNAQAPGPARLPDELHARLRGLAAEGRVVFSPVMAGRDNAPTIFLVRQLSDGRLAIGGVKTDYVREVQRAITFGARGHAAIFDATGSVLAHPNQNWWQARLNQAKIPVVQRMMAGETGVAFFHSPAMKADMVAGFTSVPRTGWGVMVPQPTSELIERANDVRLIALTIILLGLAIVAAISWMLAKRLTRPVQAVAEAARELASGNLEARVKPPSKLTPSELSTLAQAFNHMASEVKRQNVALAAAADRAESANRAKTDFLATMSHEFRTPLNAILGFSELIRSKAMGPLSPRYEGYANDIHASGSHLLSMINEILDFTKVESGAIAIERADVDVAELAQASVRMVRPIAEARKQSLDVQIEPGLPPLHTDGKRVQQILLNLLSNAVKFTPEGGAVQLVVTGTAQGGVRLAVADNGVGIADKDIPVVMEPFGQVHTPMTARPSEGTGLGLPLTRRLAEVLGGKFELTSAPGQGTVVVVVLPSLVRQPLVASAAD